MRSHASAATSPAPADNAQHARLLVATEDVRVLGVRIANLSRDEAIERMQQLVVQGETHGARAIYIVNAHTLNLATEDPEYRAALNRADAVFGDGVGVRWAARLQRVRMRDNLVGTDLIPLFLERTLNRRLRYFFLGGKPEVVSAAAEHVQRRFPGVRIVGHSHGHFPAQARDNVIRAVNAVRPDIVLVAMGNPVQERWIDEHRAALDAKLCVGVGGLVDHWGGVLTRAPRWVRRHGLEWVQLLLQQPHKWRRYLIGNPKFVYRVLRDVSTASR